MNIRQIFGQYRIRSIVICFIIIQHNVSMTKKSLEAILRQRWSVSVAVSAAAVAGVEAGRAPGGRPSVLEQREGRWDGHHRPVGDLEGAELEPPAVELNLCSRRDKKPLRHFNRSCLCEMQGWLSPSRCQHKAGQWPLSFLMHAQTLTDSVGIKKVFGKWNWNCLWGRFQWHHRDAENWARVEKCTIAFTGLSQTEPKYSTKWSRSAKMTYPMQ